MKNRKRVILAVLILLIAPAIIWAGGKSETSIPEPTVSKTSTNPYANLPDIKMTFSTSSSKETVYCVAAQKLFDGLKEATDGKIRVDAFYSGALGLSAASERDSATRGTLDMFIASTTSISNNAPYLAPFSAGYIFESYEHYRKVMDSEFWQGVNNRIAKDLGMRFLKADYTGMRHLNLKGKKVIKTPADLATYKLRSINSPTALFLTKNVFGANPMAVDFAELYQALQTGAVDGHENPLPTIKANKLYEVTESIVLTGHSIEAHSIVMSEKRWQALPTEYKQLIDKIWAECVKWTDATVLQDEKDLIKFMQDKGLAVMECDRQAFIDQASKSYATSPAMAPYMDMYLAIKEMAK